MMQERIRTERIRENIAALASDIGERNLYQYDALAATATFIDRSWTALGYQVEQQLYEAKGLRFANLEVKLTGTDRSEEIIIVGAHYDTHRKSPGANDNGSAIAALLELARALQEKPSRVPCA